MALSTPNRVLSQRLQPADCLFLLVDVQERLLPAMSECDSMLKNNAKLLRALQLFSIPLLVSEQYPQGLGKTAASLRALYGEDVEVCEKRCFSVADDGAFIEKINDKSRSTVLVSGIETHICVWQSARDLANRGYRVVVVGDATTSRSPKDHNCALSCLQQIGIGVVSVEMLLFDLQKTSEGENFKSISKLVR